MSAEGFLGSFDVQLDIISIAMKRYPMSVDDTTKWEGKQDGSKNQSLRNTK